MFDTGGRAVTINPSIPRGIDIGLATYSPPPVQSKPIAVNELPLPDWRIVPTTNINCIRNIALTSTSGF